MKITAFIFLACITQQSLFAQTLTPRQQKAIAARVKNAERDEQAKNADRARGKRKQRLEKIHAKRQLEAEQKLEKDRRLEKRQIAHLEFLKRKEDAKKRRAYWKATVPYIIPTVSVLVIFVGIIAISRQKKEPSQPQPTPEEVAKAKLVIKNFLFCWIVGIVFTFITYAIFRVTLFPSP